VISTEPGEVCRRDGHGMRGSVCAADIAANNTISAAVLMATVVSFRFVT